MTVTELRKALTDYEAMGHGDLPVFYMDFFKDQKEPEEVSKIRYAYMNGVQAVELL